MSVIKHPEQLIVNFTTLLSDRKSKYSKIITLGWYNKQQDHTAMAQCFCITHCSSWVISLWLNRDGKWKFQNSPFKQWNSCQFTVLVELQSSGCELGGPSCLSPPGSIALDAHFQGHLANSMEELNNVGNDPKKPNAAAARAPLRERRVWKK